MEPNVFEGTWEEVAGRAAEFAGRRVRLTVLEDRPAPMPLDRALAGLLEAAEQLRREVPGPPGPAPATPWAEGVLEKFRAQGFRL